MGFTRCDELVLHAKEVCSGDLILNVLEGPQGKISNFAQKRPAFQRRMHQCPPD